MDFLKKIPGFRSNKRKNKVMASLYYGFMLLSMIACFPSISEMSLIIFFTLAPFLFFGAIDVLKGRKDKKKLVFPLVATLLSFIVCGATSTPPQENEAELLSNSNDTYIEATTTENESINTDENSETDKNETSTVVIENEDNLVANNISDSNNVSDAEIHFIDTGNSDSILIKQGGESMLIDAGDNDDEDMIVRYLTNQGVSKLKYVVSTHPDADHCGGLDAVLDNIEVENVFVANGDANTKTYRDFINSVANKGLYPSVPLLGSEHKLGTSVFKVVSVANTNDVNNNSIVLLYTNGDDKILLTGDADTSILNKINVGNVDLLKVGHHGSSTSTDLSFINKVNPEYAVILCGENNRYGHPHSNVMDLLEDRKIKVHRTDECGTIVFKSSGKGLSVDCKEASYNSGNKSSNSTSTSNKPSNNLALNNSSSNNTNSNIENTATNSGVVYWTSSGKKYHSSPNCSRMKNPQSGTIEESGRTPCSKCY